MKKGRAGTMTLNVLDGTVIGQNMQRHRFQELIRFRNRIEREVPTDKAIHVILDNYAAHKKDKVQEWLARHPRWTFHLTRFLGDASTNLQPSISSAHSNSTATGGRGVCPPVR